MRTRTSTRSEGPHKDEPAYTAGARTPLPWVWSSVARCTLGGAGNFGGTARCRKKINGMCLLAEALLSIKREAKR